MAEIWSGLNGYHEDLWGKKNSFKRPHFAKFMPIPSLSFLNLELSVLGGGHFSR